MNHREPGEEENRHKVSIITFTRRRDVGPGVGGQSPMDPPVRVY